MAVIKIGVIRQTLNKAIAYISDWDKTRNGMQISTNCCPTPWDPINVAEDMQRTLDEAERRQHYGRPGEVLAYHVIQSFAPGEVHPFTAHEIGVEFAQRITGDEHDYIIATHEDRDHIHNHIIFSSANRTTWKRYRMQRRRVFEYRGISDELCQQHGLSIIENPGKLYRNIGEMYANADGRSTKQDLANEIDKAVTASFSWDAMTDRLKESGIEVYLKGNNVLFINPETMGRAVRGRKLGPAYTEAALQARLGREALSEFVVQKKMVTIIADDRARVSVPWKRGHSIVVPRDRLTDHGATYRLFLPETMTITMTDGHGNLAGQYQPDDLYEFYERPDVLRSTTLTSTSTRRGKTVAQERYFKHIDREVEALRDEGTVINLLADYKALQAAEQKPFLMQLARQINHETKELQKLLLEHQTALDAGKPGITTDLAAKNRHVRNLQGAYNKISKDRPPTQEKKR